MTMRMQKRIADQRRRRRTRVRVKVLGSAARPRLAVFRSHRHLQVQLVDDDAGRTLFTITDQVVKGKELKPVERAFKVGELVAARAIKEGISRVVFDRSRYAYHGQVKAVAEGARAGKLEL